MRVFVLCTGRCGSVTLSAACQHIANYSCGHETRVNRVVDRLEYPDNRIEVDNRLSWFLGLLDEQYGDDPIYVHLERDREQVAQSMARRTLEANRRPGLRGRAAIVMAAARVGGERDYARGMATAFTHDIVSNPKPWSEAEQLDACRLYVDTVTANINLFLKDKTNVFKMNLSTIEDDFRAFWDLIGAEGDLNAALSELGVRHNPSGSTEDPRKPGARS